jgi:hypothetical protein
MVREPQIGDKVITRGYCKYYGGKTLTMTMIEGDYYYFETDKLYNFKKEHIIEYVEDYPIYEIY